MIRSFDRTAFTMTFLCFISFVSICLPLASFAESYRSGFGFEVSVPDVWLVLTRGEVANRSDLLLGDTDAETTSVLDAIPESTRRVVFDRIQRGEIEIFYRREPSPDGFVDNVNVIRQSSKLPSTEEEVESICRVLPVEFSRIFGRPITMDACEMRDMVGRRALYFQFDGAVAGTKSMQYQVERQAGETIVLTASSETPRLPRMLSEFEAIVSSIRFD